MRLYPEPPLSTTDLDEVVTWIQSLPIGDVAYIHGACFQLMAISQERSELDLYEEFARRAAADPDCQVVRA